MGACAHWHEGWMGTRIINHNQACKALSHARANLLKSSPLMARSSCLDPLLQLSRCRLLLCSGAGEQFHASSLWETPKTEEMQSYGTFFNTPCIKIRCRRKSILLPLLAPLCRYDMQENSSFSAEPPAPRCHSPAWRPHQLCGRGAAPPGLRPPVMLCALSNNSIAQVFSPGCSFPRPEHALLATWTQPPLRAHSSSSSQAQRWQHLGGQVAQPQKRPASAQQTRATIIQPCNESTSKRAASRRFGDMDPQPPGSTESNLPNTTRCKSSAVWVASTDALPRTPSFPFPLRYCALSCRSESQTGTASAACFGVDCTAQFSRPPHGSAEQPPWIPVKVLASLV